MPPQNKNTTTVSAAPPPTLREEITGLFHRPVNPDVPARNTSGTPGNQSMRDDWNKMPKDEQDKLINSMSAEQQDQFATKMGWFGHATGISSQPKFGTIPWMKEKALSTLNRGATWLPTAGGLAGGPIGGAVGGVVAPEGGEVPGKIIGSGVLGGLGEAGRQGIEHLTGADKYDDPETKTWDARLDKISHQAEWQAAGEVSGQMLGKWMRPTLERSLSKLYYAGGIKYGNPLGKGDLQTVIDDVLKTEKSGVGKATTVGDFLGVIKQAKNDIGQQVDAQLALPIKQNGKMVMLGKAEADSTPIVTAINNMATADPSIVKEATLNKAGKEAVYLENIRREALKFSQQPWTYGELTSKRIRLNNELAPLYTLPPGEQRVYLLDHPDLAVKKAEADAIRDIVYPKMDQLTGAPAGTTAEMQGKRGALMSLENQVNDHLSQIKTKALQAHGAPVWEKTNVSTYGTTSGRPGLAIHRLTGLIHTPNPERTADKKVAQAFGNTVGAKVRKAVTAPLGSKTAGDEILSMPLRYFVNPSQRKPEDNDSDGPQSSVAPTATPKELLEKAKRLNPAAQGQVAYNHLAVNPKTGHRIGSRDGVSWEDVESGQQVA